MLKRELFDFIIEKKKKYDYIIFTSYKMYFSKIIKKREKKKRLKKKFYIYEKKSY